MRHYRLTESRIKRIIRYPARVEEAVVEGAIACMQPAGGKQYSEIWTIYIIVHSVGGILRKHARPVQRRDSLSVRSSTRLRRGHAGRANDGFREHAASNFAPLVSGKEKEKKIKVITAWRYPGKSPKRNPIPAEILREVQSLL